MESEHGDTAASPPSAVKAPLPENGASTAGGEDSRSPSPPPQKENTNNNTGHHSEEDGRGDDDTVGPLPSEMTAPEPDESADNSCSEPPKKKRKKRVLKDEALLLKSLPTAQYYEVSYMHRNVITHLAYSKTHYLITCSCDGHLKFWRLAETFGLEFVKHYRAHLGAIHSLAISSDGELACTVSEDKTAKIFDVVNFGNVWLFSGIRIFKTLTGKITLVYDESLQRYSEQQQSQQLLPSMEFGRRLALEKEIDRTDGLHLCNLLFDQSGNFLIYSTLLGIRVVNLVTNRLVRSLGGPENLRFMQVELLPPRSVIVQSAVSMALLGVDSAVPSLEMHAVEGTADSSVTNAAPNAKDPVLVCTAFKKNRVFLFTNREPHEIKSEGGSLAQNATSERDVFNEKPTKEEVLAATRDSATTATRLAGSAILHTTLGDIHIRLWPRECPRTVENFVGHSRAGYYNGHIFHRVIKGFMIQTGCPLALGMDVVQKISNIKTNPKSDRPLEDVNIISISVKDLGAGV
nr:unnamed protein product [Spirometra erinaceieuropaei]